MSWWKKKTATLAGSALFKGALAPRAENYEVLRKDGFELVPRPEADGAQWGLDVSHPKWGRATFVCLRNAPMPPRDLIDLDPRLDPAERAAIAGAGSTVTVAVEPASDDVLRERKRLLKMLRAAIGPWGVAGVDHLSQTFWSREALDGELAHDAAVDIQSLFTIHAVGDEGRVEWLHTHGLRDFGGDFDVLDPAGELLDRAYDLVRALAFAIAEGTARPDGKPFELAEPGGTVRLVSSERFMAKGKAPAWLKEQADDEHVQGHSVVCDPPGGFSLFGDKPRPSKFLSGAMPAELLIQFSTTATNLMAQRARDTYAVLRGLVEEFRGIPLPIVAKIGYVVDGGGPEDREHLWFEVHGCADGKLEGTLANEPFRIARMKQGQRGWHDAALLTDWMMMSPAGQVTPRSLGPLKILREKKEELRKALQEPNG